MLPRQMCRTLTHICISEGQGKCLARGPGSAAVLGRQASVLKASLPALCLAKELSQGLGCSGTGSALPRGGCLSGGRGNYSIFSGEANEISGQTLVWRIGVSGNDTKGRE